MNTSKLDANIDALRELVQSKGWTIVAEKEIAYGYQLLVTDGNTKVPVDLFWTGKALIQGKPGELQTQLKSWWNTRNNISPNAQVHAFTQSTFVEEILAPLAEKNYVGRTRIGLDESGKGDYFGPLVIGAVFVDVNTEDKLITLGVRDSKQLYDKRILALAEQIKAMCPHFVVPIEPVRYNELYAKVKNLNRLLAWGHGWTLENLLQEVKPDLAIVDKFGDDSYVRAALQDRGRQITVIQQTHAEADSAVAAASILARARFVQFMEQLSRKVGKTLPKGASDPSIVKIGRELVAEYGKDILREVAKLHFKTTEAILQGWKEISP